MVNAISPSILQMKYKENHVRKKKTRIVRHLALLITDTKNENS